MDATYRIQANSGTVATASTTATATLPNPTKAGSTIMLYVGVSGIGSFTNTSFLTADPPWYLETGSGGHFYIMRRPDEISGETSWGLSSPASTVWGWRVEEWASWSTTAQPDATTTQAGLQSYVINTGVQNNNSAGSPVTGVAPAPDIPDFGGQAFFFALGNTDGIFPLYSYSSGWSAVDDVTLGDGSHTADFKMLLAESYPGVSGSVDCTMTWDTSNGGSYASKNVDAYVACYRPAVPVPAAVVVTS